MNRIILVGNGFDLAHRMKTGYNDFIIWYLKHAFNSSFNNRTYEDGLAKIVCKFPGYMDINTIRTVDELIDYHYQDGFEQLINSEYLEIRSVEYMNPFIVKIKAPLLRILLKECRAARWVDIENEFYKQLKEVLKLYSKDPTNELKSLNESLQEIIKMLEKYLCTIKPNGLRNEFMQIIEGPIRAKDLVTINLKGDVQPESILVLNFNYTDTISHYLDDLNLYKLDENIQINYIHGKLRAKNNPIIFGFGDELDDDYLRMEKENHYGYFEYIKSFWYSKTSNYFNLIRFLNSDDFQVCIFGHSCGLSDRTMLHMIFEHEKCKSIKIYYYDWGTGNNFTTLNQDISRHFEDKGEMRKRIVPFDCSIPLPQYL